MELVEHRASLRRKERLKERLMLLQPGGDVAGAVILEGGQIHCGAQLFSQYPVDAILRRDAPQLAEVIAKILRGRDLAATTAELSPPLPLTHQAALCGMTARTLRRLAAVYQPGAEVIGELNHERPLLGALKVTFSPLELLLAAGRRGPICREDLAVHLYGSPPARADERWLFEWQQDTLSPEPWPIMTTRIDMRQFSTATSIGRLGQGLLALRGAHTKPDAARVPRLSCWRFADQACVLLSTARYATLLIYAAERFERILPRLALWMSPEPAATPSGQERSVELPVRSPLEPLPRQPPPESAAAESAAASADRPPVLWERSRAAAAPILSLRGLAVHLGSRPLLEDLSCDIAEAGTYLLRAPEGGEKRLFICALCGPRPVQMRLTGSALYTGRSLPHAAGPALPRSSPQLLMMKLSDYMISNLPGRDTLSQAELIEMAEALVRQAGHPELVPRFSELLGDLSVGERRILEILRAAAPRPALLLLDEPLAGVSTSELPRLLTLLKQQAAERAVLILAQETGALSELAPHRGFFTAHGLTAEQQPDTGTREPTLQPTAEPSLAE